MKQQLVFVLEPSPVIQDVLLTAFDKRVDVIFFPALALLMEAFSDGPPPQMILLPLTIDQHDHFRLLILMCQHDCMSSGRTKLHYFLSGPHPTHVVYPMKEVGQARRYLSFPN